MPHDRDRPLRVAIIGCGQIADAHLRELAKCEAAVVVATCDVHMDVAAQAARRFDVPHCYDDVALMLRTETPDIVHIATPAQTHVELAVTALAAGAHVYIEKPLALSERDARRIMTAANAAQRRVCVGHDQLFDPTWRELRRRITAGDVGAVSHVEATLGYAISGPFGRAVASDKNHWVRHLPGGLFHNTISHPLYQIGDLLTDEKPEIMARWWNAGHDFPTDLIVHLRGATVTGTLTFSARIAPQRMVRVYGSNGMLELDLDAQTVNRSAPPPLPGALGKLAAPWLRRRDAARSWRRNIRRFLRSDIHYFAGMHALFTAFQASVRDPSAPDPISAKDMLRVTDWMDRIFETCRRDAPHTLIDAAEPHRLTEVA